VHTKKKSTILERLEAMSRDGPQKFQVISPKIRVPYKTPFSCLVQVVADFDMTLTKYYVNGGRGCTCHGKVYFVMSSNT